MSDDLMPDRLKDQARKIRSLIDTIERLEVGNGETGNDAFRLPYATVPKLRPSGFKLTFPT